MYKNQMENHEMQLSKEEGRLELEKLFGIKDTKEFQQALENGNIKGAVNWLNHVVEKKPRYQTYEETWENWLFDRKKEISQANLFALFGIRKTADFREFLNDPDKIDIAIAFVSYVENNRKDHPQYNDGWLEDRKKDIEQSQS